MIEMKIVLLQNGNWLYANHIFDESYGKHSGSSMFTFRFPEHSKLSFSLAENKLEISESCRLLNHKGGVFK